MQYSDSKLSKSDFMKNSLEMYIKIKDIEQDLMDYKQFIKADYDLHYSVKFTPGFIDKSL